jgi:replicative DNA helicase
MPEAAVAERTLPHNLEAERSVLGAVLLHNDAFNLAAEVIDSHDFFRDAHRRIFDKMVKLAERGDAIDLVTLKEELGRSGELDEVGGPTSPRWSTACRGPPTSSITRASSRRRPLSGT